MIGGRSALLGAASGLGYGNWTGNYSDVSLLLRGNSVPGPPVLAPADESSNPVTITTTGATGISTTVFQYGDGSLFFPNNSSTATTAALSAFAFGSGDFTLEFWMRVSNPTWPFDFGLPFGIGNYGSGANISFAFSGSNFGIFNQAASGFSRSVGRGTDGVFHHVALCRSSSVTRFFYDGILIGTTDLTTQSFGNSVLYLNRVSEYSTSGIINGLHIDDLRVTRNFARYTSNFTPPTAELPANATNDPSYNSVSLLLRGNTRPGPLVLADESPTPKAITAVGNAGINTTTFKYGGNSLSAGSAPGYAWAGSQLTVAAGAAFAYGTGNYTVEAWIYPTGDGSAQFNQGFLFFSQLTGGTNYFLCGYMPGGTGQVQFTHVWAASGTGVTAYSPAVPKNQWHHVAIVRNAGQVIVYVNGVGGAAVSNTQNFTDTSFVPTLGGYTAGINAFEGIIDDLRITKGIARYTKNFLPPPAQLPAI